MFCNVHVYANNFLAHAILLKFILIPVSRHGLVDVGSIETAKDLIKKMNHSSYKGDAVIADFMKKDAKTDAKPMRANTKSSVAIYL